MQKDTARGFEDAVHFRNPFLEPRDIMINTAGPAVLKTADLPRVSPDNLVVAVAEKRRVKVDEVNAVRFHTLEDFKIVAEDKAVYFHGRAIWISFLAGRAAEGAQAAVLRLLPVNYALFLE
jgi:hypothetical protein